MFRPEDVRELLRKQPFQPFRMHMSNGQWYDVNHPEMALVTKGTIIVAKPIPGSNEPIGEGVNHLAVMHINNIEVLPKSTSPATGNGAT